MLRPTSTVKPISSIIPTSAAPVSATSQAPNSQANRLSSNFDLLSSLHETAPPAQNMEKTIFPNVQENKIMPEFETSNLLNKISSLSTSRVVPRLVKVPDQVIQLITNTTYPPDQFRIMSKTIAAARCSSQLNRQQQCNFNLVNFHLKSQWFLTTTIVLFYEALGTITLTLHECLQIAPDYRLRLSVKYLFLPRKMIFGE